MIKPPFVVLTVCQWSALEQFIIRMNTVSSLDADAEGFPAYFGDIDKPYGEELLRVWQEFPELAESIDRRRWLAEHQRDAEEA